VLTGSFITSVSGHNFGRFSHGLNDDVLHGWFLIEWSLYLCVISAATVEMEKVCVHCSSVHPSC